MQTLSAKLTGSSPRKGLLRLLCLGLLFLLPLAVIAQVDQGGITGVVTDNSGAAIPRAKVTLKDVGTGLVQTQQSNGSGIFNFSPIKIGKYSVSATAQGFATVSRENVQVDIQQRVNVTLALPAGSVTENVVVETAAPLLETQTSSIGQVFDTKAINETPLNGRNWVYIAQLTAGVAPPPSGATRGAGKGDFIANGQRAEQNNFILDGVDNNTNLVDFLNGSSYVQRPPPDALAEFSIQTNSYSAEFGHSAGAVLVASIKSGTNQVHGSGWEYFRSDKLNAQDWTALTIPRFHEHQFGATLGFPVIKNKMFFFGDVEANRVNNANPGTYTVPTALIRQGNFSELLNPNLTGQSQPRRLYQPGSAGTVLQTYNGQQNVLNPAQINKVALNLLNLFPLPNTNGGNTYNNYNVNVRKADNTFQWDTRLDYNISAKDQLYGRFSYNHELIQQTLPFGTTLDGSGYGGYRQSLLAENGMISETHVFGPKTVNEFRAGYNWGQFNFLQNNFDNTTLAGQLGLGNVPFSPFQGGLPQFNVSGISTFGTQGTSDESQNVYQILDNVSRVFGNHSLKVGAAVQNVRFYYVYAATPRGAYGFDGTYSSQASASFTGYGVADFLTNYMHTANASNAPNIHDQQWYDSGYIQDDWRVSPKLTINAGLRYDWYEPYRESRDQQANIVVGPNLGFSTGSATYQLPSAARKYALYPNFLATLAKNNVALEYVNNARLVSTQYTNFAPRVGVAYTLDPKTVIRAGFGIFYGGLQSNGNGNLGANYPFSLTANYSVPSTSSCNVVGTCPTLQSTNPAYFTLESGLPALTTTSPIANPSFHTADFNEKTPYTENYNVSMERALSANVVFSLAYVGNETRHLATYFDANAPLALLRNGSATQAYRPFPDLGSFAQNLYSGYSNYNSLQTKVDKRFSHGLSFLTTYTWAHALDDSGSAGGLSSGIGVRSYRLLGVASEYTNSSYDVRHRFTVNGNYQIPVGRGRAFVKNNRLLNYLIGGWSVSATFAAQSGSPFGGIGSQIGTASGGGARAFLVGDPFAPGGTPAQPGGICPTTVRNRAHWFNPCAFRDPLPGSTICPATGTVAGCLYAAGSINTAALAAPFLGSKQNLVYGPGYYRLDNSLFKNFTTIREQFIQFRVDAFNSLNHPTNNSPSGTTDNNAGGVITSRRTFQNNSPDARFLQLSAKYVF